jgi:hypothetical protein
MPILTEKPKEWESYQRVLPSGFVPIETKDAIAHPNVLKAARSFIDKHVRDNKPIGYRENQTVDGRMVVFTIEPHYHEPNGPAKPWGWHKGCSVSVEAPHFTYGPQVAGEDDLGMDAVQAAKVKHVAVVGVPAVVGFFFLGPLGAVLGTAGGLAWNHFKK